MRVRISALFLSVALSTVAASAQSNQTLTGTVTDAMCGAQRLCQVGNGDTAQQGLDAITDPP